MAYWLFDCKKIKKTLNSKYCHPSVTDTGYLFNYSDIYGAILFC